MPSMAHPALGTSRAVRRIQRRRRFSCSIFGLRALPLLPIPLFCIRFSPIYVSMLLSQTAISAQPASRAAAAKAALL